MSKQLKVTTEDKGKEIGWVANRTGSLNISE